MYKITKPVNREVEYARDGIKLALSKYDDMQGQKGGKHRCEFASMFRSWRTAKFDHRKQVMIPSSGWDIDPYHCLVMQYKQHISMDHSPCISMRVIGEHFQFTLNNDAGKIHISDLLPIRFNHYHDVRFSGIWNHTKNSSAPPITKIYLDGNQVAESLEPNMYENEDNIGPSDSFGPYIWEWGAAEHRTAYYRIF